MTAIPRVSAVLGLWLDRPPLEALDTAQLVDELGYPELWIGEMATFDAFALASAVAARTARVDLTVGPLAAAVRTPVGMVMGAATVAATGERAVHLAIGSSSAAVVEGWHGRSAARPAAQLAATAEAIRPLLDGERGPGGFRLRLDTPPRSLTIAAFGERAVEVAAAHADRMVINLVTVEAAATLKDQLDKAAAAAGRDAPPRLAAWVACAVDPDDETRAQLKRGLVPYLAARGYDTMFERAGFGDVVAFAQQGAHPRDVLPQMPDEIVDAVGMAGDAAHVRRRIDAYAAAGVDEVCLVAATAGDPAGRRTLTALAPTKEMP